jgi:hypothetical protein
MKDLTHDQIKALYLAYREKAKQLVSGSELLSVSDHANVQLCEEGAFVECHLWVSKEAL